MVESPTDDRTREDETVVDDSDATETNDAAAARTAGGSTVRDGTTDADADDTARTDDYGDDTARTDDYGDGDDGHTGLLWFSAAGAVILGLLWLVDVTGWFGLTWAVLGSTTTLALAVIAAIGAVLFWYDGESSDATSA